MPEPAPSPRDYASTRLGRDDWPFDPATEPGLETEPLEFAVTAVVAWHLKQDLHALRYLWSTARIERRTQPQIREELARRYRLTTVQLGKIIEGRRYLQITEVERFLGDASVGYQLRPLFNRRQHVLYDHPTLNVAIEASAERWRAGTFDTGGAGPMQQEPPSPAEARRQWKTPAVRRRVRATKRNQLVEIETALEALIHIAAGMQRDLHAVREPDDDLDPADGSRLGIDWGRMHAQLRDHGLRRRIAAQAPAAVAGIPFAAAVRAVIPYRRQFTLADVRTALGTDLVHQSSSNVLYSTIDSMVKRGELIRVGRGRYESTALLGKRATSKPKTPGAEPAAGSTDSRPNSPSTDG